MDSITSATKDKPRPRHLSGTARFAMLPLEALRCLKRATDLKVYAVICAHADKLTAECFPSQRVIGEQAGLNISEVGRTVKRLQAKRLIKITERSGTTSLYTVIPPAFFGFAADDETNDLDNQNQVAA